MSRFADTHTRLVKRLVRKINAPWRARMETARVCAEAAIRPATLAAEFSTAKRRVTKEEIVEAIAKALLPFVPFVPERKPGWRRKP